MQLITFFLLVPQNPEVNLTQVTLFVDSLYLLLTPYKFHIRVKFSLHCSVSAMCSVSVCAQFAWDYLNEAFKRLCTCQYIKEQSWCSHKPQITSPYCRGHEQKSSPPVGKRSDGVCRLAQCSRWGVIQMCQVLVLIWWKLVFLHFVGGNSKATAAELPGVQWGGLPQWSYHSSRQLWAQWQLRNAGLQDRADLTFWEECAFSYPLSVSKPAKGGCNPPCAFVG